MKRKAIILLTSAVLGLGLVGGTLAAWAVTDNANPIGIKVSPGNVETAELDYVTLNWGEQKSLSNVGNLKLGSKRLAGVLDVRQSNATKTFPGRLSYLVSGDSALIDVLHIDVYSGVFADRTPGAELTSEEITAKGSAVAFAAANPAIAGETKGYDFNALANNAANLFSVVVYLDSSVDADTYATLSSYSVDISFDWGHGSTVVPVTTQTIYLKANDLGSAPKAYAWASDGSARNGEYPGVAMTQVRAGYFSIEVDITLYDKIIFNNGTKDGAQSGDIVIADHFFGKDSDDNVINMFNYTGGEGIGGTFTYYSDVVAEKEYYLVGTNLTYGGNPVTWDMAANCKLTLTAGSVTFDVSTSGGARLKIYEKSENAWISNDGNDFTLGDEGTYHITFIAEPTGTESYITAAKA